VTTTLSPPRPPAAIAPSARRRRAVEHAWIIGFACALGLVVTLGMWLRHGQLSAAHGPGGVPTAIGQLAALTGTYAVLVQLLLMSRVRWIEESIGLDRLAVWHRWLGFAVLWLLSAHVVFTTVGWASSSIPPVSVLHETGWLISHGADVLMAWAGFALFIAIAVTSVRAARRKLKRETWYFVHLYAYLAIALSFAHQLALGSDFETDRAARVWWVSLYVVVFAALIAGRVVAPLLFNRKHQMRVDKVYHETPDVVSVIVRGRGLDHVAVQPGQFFIWRFLTPRGWWQPHPFSLSAAPARGRMRITVKNLGDGFADLASLRRGTRVFAEGPYGTFTTERRTQPKVLMIAGGIGITPLRAMLDSFSPDDDVVLCYRVATPADALFGEEMQQFAATRNVKVHVIPGTDIGDDRTDKLGVPALRRNVPDIRHRDCFVCGPPALINAVTRRLQTLGVPSEQIHYERFEF
jgi:predicted ferric reductase